MANLVGDLVQSRFDDLQRLGTGGEGGAWSALDPSRGRRVVLKHVDRENHDALGRAVEILSRVGSPHLPSVLELLPASDGGMWVVTSWIEGASLAAGPVPSSQAMGEGLAVAHALAAIHGAGTHHGDVSAGNVVLTPTRGVVLVDLACLGRLGTGTPGFIAPEVLAGGGGPAADVFALGCLICFRLFGAVPWQRPEALVRIHTRTQVRQRLHALTKSVDAPVPAPVVDALSRMLDPDPVRRGSDARAWVTHLERLQSVLSGAAAVDSLTRRWWIPRRWPYRGPPVESVRAALVAGDDVRPRLVVVAGPPGSGRGRVIEEIVLAVQTVALRGPNRVTARLSDPERMSGLLGDPGAEWLEAWMRGKSGSVPTVLGVPRGARWPEGFTTTELQVAALRIGARWARDTLVVPGDVTLAKTLEGAEGVRVVDVEPWSDAVLAQVLDGVHDMAGRRAEWVTALRAVTGGWPAQVARTLSACAHDGVSEPDPTLLAEASSRKSRAEALDPDLAERILEVFWGEVTVDRSLPDHMHDGGRPLLSAVARARATLGDEVVRRLARRILDARGSSGPHALDLSLDADDASAVDRLVRGPDQAEALEAGSWARLRAWLLGGGLGYLSEPAVLALADAALRRGEVELALGWSRAGSSIEALVLEGRALQRLGQSEQAEACLRRAQARAEAEGNLDARDQCLGLRWRAGVDRGQVDRALDEARQWASHDDPRSGTGPALALLWGAYAAMASGDPVLAQRWLDDATRRCPIESDRKVLELRARISQLRGNLDHLAGRLDAAEQLYEHASEVFAEVGDRMGLLGIQAGLANLSVATYSLDEGIRHGRAAVHGLIARAELQRLPEAASAVVQLLLRVGEVDEARGIAEAVHALLDGSGSPSVLGLARLRRIDAELIMAGCAPDRFDRAGSAFADAATQLWHAKAGREAVDAKLRESLARRLAGRWARAARCLEEAQRWSTEVEDEGIALALHLERMGLAIAGRDEAAIDDASKGLRSFPSLDHLRRNGRLELAWTYVRALFLASRARLPAGHPSRRRAALAVVETLEMIVAKAPQEQRKAVQSGALAEGGDVGALKELLAELEDSGSPSGEQSARLPGGSGEAARPSEAVHLLRMYRRLAREDDLEPLLGQVVDAMMELTDAERGAVVVRAPSAGQEPLVVTRELAAGSDGFKFSRSVIRKVMESGEPVLSVDAAEDARFDESKSISHLSLRSVVAVPLVFRGEQLGAAYVDHRLRRGNFDDGDLDRMEQFAELAALAVAHARALAAVRSQAETLQRQSKELSQLLEQRDAEVQGLREAVRSSDSARPSYRGIVGESPAMQTVFRLIDRLAESDVPVVIRGESGTGKELVARAIHDAGPRRKGPFVAENCAAIPESLLEGILFGHAKGAFTGADRARSGLFEAAHGGTIFLDEISEMSPGMQTKLLRVLQEGEVRRLGENAPRKVNVRAMAASNRDLEALVAKGEFRSDLYYRIHVVPLRLPPLRERLDDLPALIRHFLQKHGGESLVVSPVTFRRLQSYGWPGNVRELENEVQRWVALAVGTVSPDDLSPALTAPSAVAQGEDGATLDLRAHVDRLETHLIEQALERTQGNQTRAAELLGLSRFGLQKKLKRLEIPR